MITKVLNSNKAGVVGAIELMEQNYFLRFRDHSQKVLD
ncbi:MAG: hypothetical protein BWX57_01112 [Tenericutes bacterium ADurb.Bin024]|nr:MAG: hypothetical protein BWX57_01112 [Tenericutes bacterium ADurb.Bin024]